MYLYITNCDGKITTVNAYMFMCVCFLGALIKGEHSKTGPKTQLHPRQLHGGGHGWLPWWTGHIFLCQSKAEQTAVFGGIMYPCLFLNSWDYDFLSLWSLFFFHYVLSRIFSCRKNCPRMLTKCLSLHLRRPWKMQSPAARTMRRSWQAVP